MTSTANTLNQLKKLTTVVADGAYYSIEGVEKLSNQGITPAIPPPSNATIHGKDNTKWHDEVVGYIKEKGSVYAFYKKYCYGIRARIEAQISRIKRCIGSSLLTKKIMLSLQYAPERRWEDLIHGKIKR